MRAACGKAEILVRLAERYGIAGVGVDRSPYCIRDAWARAAERVPEADLRFVEQDGAAFRGEPESFDVAMCLGASWVFGGYAGTLRALAGWVRPGSLVLVGEPSWIGEPEPEYLAATGMSRDAFLTHAGNVQAGLERGLTFVYAWSSSPDDWDRYELLQCQAAKRDSLGWAADLFMK